MNSTPFQKQNTLPNFSFENIEIDPCPSQIGPYKIKGLFKKGGMSILYIGIDPKTSKPIIIKVLSPKLIKNKEIVDRFLKEAKIISLSNHPNIIKLLGQGRWEQGLYIAMEFIQGISLRQFIEQRVFSPKKALEIILQVSYALTHLHSHGIIHRDLKPENILITEGGEIKVIDFGISKLKEEKMNIEHKRLIGTPIYMSPEQKENSENVTFSSDIFSLGIITYELIIGRLSRGKMQLSLLSKNLKKIIEKALEKDIKKRYSSIVDFITDVSQYIKNSSEKPKENIHEITKALDSFQEMLLLDKAPNWPQMEIGLYKEKVSHINSLYLDFLKLPENKHVIIMAETLKMGIASLNHLSILKGMIKASFYQKNDIHLTTILSSLNQLILNDLTNSNFTINILMLLPEKSQFLFSSCGYKFLVRILKDSKKISTLSTPNNLLGEKEDSLFVETAGNWHIGDKLILCSLDLLKNEELLKTSISSSLMFPIKSQPKKILSQMPFEKDSTTPKAIINIERLH